MTLDDALHDGQTDAAALKPSSAVQTVESVEQLAGVHHVETLTIVLGEEDALGPRVVGSDVDHGLFHVARRRPKESRPDRAGKVVNRRNPEAIDARKLRLVAACRGLRRNVDNWRLSGRCEAKSSPVPAKLTWPAMCWRSAIAAVKGDCSSQLRGQRSGLEQPAMTGIRAPA